MTTGAISRTKLQSNHHHKKTSSFLQAGCPSCRPTNSVKALKGKISHSMDLLTPSSPGGLPTLSPTINSSWLPWGRVAMPLISPLMPVPHNKHNHTGHNHMHKRWFKNTHKSVSMIFRQVQCLYEYGKVLQYCLNHYNTSHPSTNYNV